jgi:predicted dehydrogenase
MLNWLVAGVGDIATRRVLPAILSEPRSRLHAVVTSQPAKAQAYGVPGYANFTDALTDPAIHAVYIATPVALHHPSLIAALQAGKHVLCEKPTAMNYAEAQQMAEAAAKHPKLICAVAYYRRRYAKVMEAKRLIDAGAIGQPVLAELNCHSWFNPTDGHRSWLIDPALAGGGPSYDIAVHSYAVEDNATIIADYPNGARGIVDVRWHSRVERDACRIIGTDGELNLDPLNGPLLRTPTGDLHLPAPENLHFPLIADFVDAVLDGKKPACPIAEAISTDWVTSQIR